MIREQIRLYNKKNTSVSGIKKKKQIVWRKEAIWGIEPEFLIKDSDINHNSHKHKVNYNIVKQQHVKMLQDEQEVRDQQLDDIVDEKN